MNILHTLILILHVLGSGLVVGGIIMAILLVVRKLPDATIADMLHRTWLAIEIGIGAQFITGTYLIISERDTLEKNHWLWAKLSLYLLAGAVSGILIKRHLKKIKQMPTAISSSRKSLLIGLWSVLLIVIGIVSCGVIIVETAVKK